VQLKNWAPIIYSTKALQLVLITIPEFKVIRLSVQVRMKALFVGHIFPSTCLSVCDIV
jgi:hypothetical protein